MALPSLTPESPESPVAAVGRVFRNVSFLAGSQAASWAFTLVWVVVAARVLGPVGLGQLAVSVAATSLGEVIFGVGLSALIIKEVARHHHDAGSLVGAALVSRALLAVPAVLAMALFINLGHFHGAQATVLWISSVTLAGNLLTGPLQDTLQGLQRMEYMAYTSVLAKAGITIFGSLLLLTGHGVVSLAWLFAAISIVSLVLSATWVAPRLTVQLRPGVTLVREVLRGGVPYWLTGIIYTVYLSVDAVILSLMAPVRVVGWYSVSTRLFGTLLFVPTILATAWLPRLCADFKREQRAFGASARAALELVAVVALPVAAGTALVGPAVMRFLYGASFAPAAPVIIVLGLTVPATYISMITWQLIVASDRQAGWTPVMAVGTVANVVLNLLLIPAFQVGVGNGAVGAAVALLATETTIAFLGWRMTRHLLTGMSLGRLLRGAVATAGMSAAALAVARLGTAVEIGVSVISFAGLALGLRVVSATELRAITSFAAGLRRRRLAVEGP